MLSVLLRVGTKLPCKAWWYMFWHYHCYLIVLIFLERYRLKYLGVKNPPVTLTGFIRVTVRQTHSSVYAYYAYVHRENKCGKLLTKDDSSEEFTGLNMLFLQIFSMLKVSKFFFLVEKLQKVLCSVYLSIYLSSRDKLVGDMAQYTKTRTMAFYGCLVLAIFFSYSQFGTVHFI